MNKLNTKKLRKTLTIHIFSRFMITVIIYTLAFFTMFLFAIYFVRAFISYGGPIDRILRVFYGFSNRDINLLFLIPWSTGVILIFSYYWRKTFGYIEMLIEANNTLFQSPEDLVHLPSELKEVEDQLNRIKYDVLRNERAAKEAEQRKNDLVVYLAHDLKTPLTSVIGYLSLLRDEQKISEELRLKYLEISLEKAERLEDLINEFFEITRFNLTSIALEISQFNLTRMLEQISHEFNPMLAPKNLTCILKADHELTVKGDVKKLERVFDNLIRNAINYSFDNSQIEIFATKNERGILLKFINQGNTIPEQRLNHIFEQFYRLDTARTSQTGGAGLGLAIAKEIIELHQGTITASSHDEKIQFEVFLPILS